MRVVRSSCDPYLIQRVCSGYTYIHVQSMGSMLSLPNTKQLVHMGLTIPDRVRSLIVLDT